LHLDLIMMGGLVTATGVAVPQLPRTVTIPLAVGCWTNALAFAPPAIKPSLTSTPGFRAVVTASFVTTTASWVAVAAIALHRWAGLRPHKLHGALAASQHQHPPSGHQMDALVAPLRPRPQGDVATAATTQVCCSTAESPSRLSARGSVSPTQPSHYAATHTCFPPARAVRRTSLSHRKDDLHLRRPGALVALYYDV
jgi:hypothetical protein